MTIVAFLLIAFMFAMYVILDGYDLGVAAIAPFFARDDRERNAAMKAIGPFWNGNEVWLVAGGATLFALFPKAFASAFSGFYLPLIIALWLLMARGAAMELRNHYDGPLWHQFWDTLFSVSSAVLIVVFGVALGNLLRGVPLDADGYFRGTFAFLLNPYALGVGMFALVALCAHGASFLALRIENGFVARVRSALPWLWLATVVCFFGVTIATLMMRNDLLAHPGVIGCGLLGVVALIGVRVAMVRAWDAGVFIASSAFLASMLAVSAQTMYPYLLRDFPGTDAGISIFSSAPSPVAQLSALVVTVLALAAVIVYTTLLWPKLAGKIRLEE